MRLDGQNDLADHGMDRYSLLACRKGSWEIDAIVTGEDRAAAEADALVRRDRQVSAVQIVQLINSKGGIEERPTRMVFPPHPKAPAKATSPRQATRPGRRRYVSRDKLIVAAAVCAAAAIVLYGAILPKQPWPFDLPEARSPHTVRDTLTAD